MNSRYITLFLAAGMAVAFFLTQSHSHRSPLPLAVSSAAAQTPSVQTPSPQLIAVKKISRIGEDDLWNQYQIMVPKTVPPLDMHTVLLIDGKGIDVSEQKPDAWMQPVPFKYRLDTDDDDRVKDILIAQSLPVKKNLVTYRFAVAGDFGSSSITQTLQFQHGGPGEQTSLRGNETMTGAVGQKIVLENEMLADSAYRGSLDTLFTLDQQNQPEFVPKTPRGLIHHFVVYVLFQPHSGPPVKENKTYTKLVGRCWQN